MKRFGNELTVYLTQYLKHIHMEDLNMYTERDFKTKQELIEAVKNGAKIRIYAPGLGKARDNGTEYVDGPHYPQPHKWYAQVEMKDGIIVSVK